MFPSFIGILDIQSWWEVPSIAYFCSLFRTAFNLLDFDIEELEEALLTDGTEESSSLLTELIVRLLNGCLGNNDISAFNYQMYLRRLFRRKCQETGRYNPFNTDIDFQFLPLRTKVEILYALCDFRLDAEDVFDLFKNLEAESLRVEPLGFDSADSAYWYFYGTRLYREDIIRTKGKAKKKRNKEKSKRGWFYGEDWLDDDETERVWQVVCFTEEDWAHLTEKFSKATSKVEKELHRSLKQNFLPEIPRLFQEKERLQRKRLLELAPRRTSSRVLQKIKQKEEEDKQSAHDSADPEDSKETPDLARENRAKRRNQLRRAKSTSSESSEHSQSEKEEMPQKVAKRAKSQDKRSKNCSATHKGEPPPDLPIKTGRKTNNSLASATGQILIPDNDEPVSSTRKKLKTSQIFSQTEEDIQTDMYKVLEQLTAHEDAWPFMDPVEEEYAPNYYAVIRRPMDLRKMEERLDSGFYTDFSMFKADFKLIVNNCRLYNGQDNEYTTMVDKLQAAFDRLTEKYLHGVTSSDDEIAVEYQIPTPSRKHKRKSSESPGRHRRKKRKSHSDTGEPQSSTSDQVQENPESELKVHKKSKESHKSKTSKKDGKKDGKKEGKKKRKGHHRHGKHSKNHKKESQKSGHSKHNKKQKHSKHKDKDGKKSKQKKKKSKHQEPEIEESEIKRSTSMESIESSNRSRSASPLPSIHTPSPTPSPEPTEQEQLDQLNDPDFFKDKYDKIKERRRNAAKDAWESLFDYKQKTVDKQKQNLNIPEKDKNQKLRETIEKLKAKNEKYKESSLFNSLFSAGQSGDSKSRPASTTKEISSREDDNPDLFNDELEDSSKGKIVSKKGPKKSAGKNESASEALEQAVKDISKWLDDAPKGSAGNSPCDSPAQTISTEDNDNSRLDDELSVGEKTQAKKDVSRKRPSSREPKLVKRREIQRTIERLQPGKSKGNLLTNMSSKNLEKSDESSNSGIQNKIRDSNKQEEVSPKLSLGSVLATVEFTLGKDHNFANNDDNKTAETKEISEVTEIAKESQAETVISDKKTVETPVPSTKKDAEVETEPQQTMKPSQEKATPNLSAWFKAFGAPKSTVTTANVVVKKKTDEAEPDEKVVENPNNEKVVTDKNVATKTEPAVEPETPNPEGGDSPLPGASVTPRQRRTSTGSSVSERSSFSQDLDSPRHQMSHTSPLLRSPASPRTDDFQKITYPIINGTVRAGFYQDTTSIKSSPEKSCSPRDGPQSPYSPYSQHVYASNNAMGSATPNYFVDHNKSPLPTYSQNPPPYYDASKVPLINKPGRAHDDYTSLGPDSYQQNPYSAPLSPLGTPYPLTPSANYSQVQDSPQPVATSPPTAAQPADRQAESKSALFPVKKRSYSEPESPAVSIKKVADAKDITVTPINRSDYQKPNQPINQISSTPSVDDIALALTEKSELAKLNSLREKVANISAAYAATEAKDNTYEKNDGTNILDRKDIGNVNHNQPIGMIKKDNVDIVNMGYMRLDNERRNVETHEHEFTPRDVSKTNLHTNLKGYEVEAIAMNLGLNNQQMQKASMKSNSSNIPPAHAHIQERPQSDLSNMNPTIAHSHHNQFDAAQHSTALTMSNISLNDIELANKKLYSCNSTTTTSAIDYGNWKMTNQMRKQDMIPSDYSTSYGANPSDKTKPTNNSTMNTAPVNYNKTIQQQHQQYNTFNNIPRSSLQRTQELQQNLSAELRIPNPRGHLKNDSINITSSISSSEYTNKNVDSLAKNQKTQDKHVQNHPLSSPMAYKTPYSTHSGHPLETLRNLPNIPQMLERYTNDERYLSSFAGSGSLYHDKSFQMAQMFNKTMASEVHSAAASTSIYSQPATSKDIYKANAAPTPQVDTKAKAKRKRTTDTTKQAQLAASQSYHNAPCTDVLSTVKSSMMSGAFNFGTSTNMALGGGLYGDNAGFSMEDFRNSTSQLMAANYMAAAVAHQQRGADGADKLAKPAHQGGAFPFMAHGQRAGYGFAESSPLYQQYLQRHQEELLRSGAQIMGLYPPAYPAPLAARQPYDAVNRRSWL